MPRHLKAMLLGAATLLTVHTQANAQSAPAIALLDPASLQSLQATTPLVPLIANPATTIALINPGTLNTTLVSISTLPGVSSPLPYGFFLSGILNNFR